MPRQSLEERILQLERSLGSIQHEIIGARQQLPKFDNRPQIRLARVANNPSASDNTVAIVFLDGSYPKATGNQTATYLDRQLSAKEVALNISGTQLSQGDKVPVFFSNGHWWIYSPDATPPPPPAGEALINVFYDPDWYFVTGPNAGQVVPFSFGIFMSASTNYHFQDINWKNQLGPDIGIEIVPDVGGYNLTFNTPATYLITLTATWRKTWYRFVVPPDPIEWFDFEIRLDETPSSENLSSPSTLVYESWNTSTDYLNQDITDPVGVPRSATVLHTHQYSVVKRIYQACTWRMRGTLFVSGSTVDYGVDISQPFLIVQQLFS